MGGRAAGPPGFSTPGFFLLQFSCTGLTQHFLNKIPRVFPQFSPSFPPVFLENCTIFPELMGENHHHCTNNSECYYPWVTSPSLYQQFRMLLPMGYITIIVPTIQNVTTHAIQFLPRCIKLEISGFRILANYIKMVDTSGSQDFLLPN